MRTLRRYEPLARTLGATTAVGLIVGALVGGVGGRLAMRILFITSGDDVRGLISDDGFEIGQFTAETFGLIVVGALFGVVGAFVYLGVRPFLIGPPWLRTATCATASGAVLGALLVNPEGVDFTRLHPVALAVALFVAIPALFAALVVPALEHALRPQGWAHSAPAPLVLAPLALFVFPPMLVGIGGPVALVLGARSYLARSSRAVDLAGHPAAMWLARAGWAAIAILGAFALGEDLLALRSGA